MKRSRKNKPNKEDGRLEKYRTEMFNIFMAGFSEPEMSKEMLCSALSQVLANLCVDAGTEQRRKAKP